MSGPIVLVQVGQSPRLQSVLGYALDGIVCFRLSLEQLAAGESCGHKVLFAIHVDALGPDEALCRLMRQIRRHPNCLQGCAAALIVDGDSELYTKQLAQDLALAANRSGCMFLGKPLVEGTGSLYNQHILANQMGLDWEQTYCVRCRQLVNRLRQFRPPHYLQPRMLMVHASDNQRSNSVWVGREIMKRLEPDCVTREISLQNGTIADCRGCSFAACRHFAESNTCFYGGAVSEEVMPAIASCNAILFLCPNYNDAVSANIMALFNRLTNLLMKQELYDKYLFGVVVSGYSGSDLVARQLLGAMCFNKTAILAPEFCLMQTAHEPGSAQHAAGILERIDAFSDHIKQTLLA